MIIFILPRNECLSIPTYIDNSALIYTLKEEDGKDNSMQKNSLFLSGLPGIRKKDKLLERPGPGLACFFSYPTLNQSDRRQSALV